MTKKKEIAMTFETRISTYFLNFVVNTYLRLLFFLGYGLYTVNQKI